MLPKKNRLSRIEIEELKAKRAGILQGKFFGLIFQKQKGVKKFALIVSKKIASKASDRNKIKRLCFQAIKNYFFETDGKFLLLAKKSCSKGSLEEFEKETELFQNKIAT